MSNLDNLTPWKPGQSGNPAGGSLKARARKYLRDTLPEALAEELSPEDLEALKAEGEKLLLAEAAALRVKRAIVSGTHAELMDALRLAVSVEPKQYEVGVTGNDALGLGDALAAASKSRRSNGDARDPHPGSNGGSA